MLRGRLDAMRVWESMDTCICMAESLCYPSQIITTLLIGYTPIQNKKLKKIFLKDVSHEIFLSLYRQYSICNILCDYKSEYIG